MEAFLDVRCGAEPSRRDRGGSRGQSEAIGGTEFDPSDGKRARR